MPLPPLNAIRAFEVAARHLSFSRAAEELGVTQGAISKQVIALEDYIGARLFERAPGGLSLTTDGMNLRHALAPAFGAMSEAFSRYHRRPPRSNVCRVSTLASFASHILVPRLTQFEEELPHIRLEMLTSDRIVDLSREEVDFSVRYGPGGREDAVEIPLVKGELAAVCAPEFREGLDDIGLEAFVRSVRRIQVFTANEWSKWSETSGIDIAEARAPFVIEDFIVAIVAVLAGQGAAILPELLVRQYLESGRMVRFWPERLDWSMTYYIAHIPGADRRSENREVMEWLRKIVAG